MNVLPIEKQIQIISALVEGNSIRVTARMVGVEHKTVMRVLLRVGENCAHPLDSKMQSLPCKIMQADEIWTYVGKHERFVTGKDNPLGKRNAENTWVLRTGLAGTSCGPRATHYGWF